MIARFSILAASLFLFACGGTSQQPAPASTNDQSQAKKQVTQQLKPQQFAQLLSEKSDAVVLDVRTPQEVADGVIECNEVHYDFYESDFRDRLKTMDHDTPVFVYCAVGGRSGQAMDFLQREGFSEVYNLDGGIRAWTANGLGTEKCD